MDINVPPSQDFIEAKELGSWRKSLALAFSPVIIQNSSSLALPVWDSECLEDILTKGWVNESVTDGGDWRRASATPGLLNIDLKNLISTKKLAVHC